MSTPQSNPSSSRPRNFRGIRGSLRLQITLLYIVLALLNITFFSVMILESQMALLLKVFRLQARELENRTLGGAAGRLSREKDAAYRRFTKGLLADNIENFIIFDRTGEIWHRSVRDPETAGVLAEMRTVPPRLRQMTLNFSRDSSLLSKNSEARLNEDDYSVELLTMIETAKEPVFLFTVISVDEIRDGRNKIYAQVGWILFFGILFHIAFGFYLYYLIFRRVGKLKEASDRMARGDLSARADWRSRNQDELDELGNSFNDMAERIEDQVDTISNLNAVMTREMEIGKEVQERFLPDRNPFGDALMIYYRPLREVSGDIYGFFDFQERFQLKASGLFFADASGHGVSAALITSILMTFLDEALRETTEPAEILKRLNRQMTGRLQAHYFATGVFFVIDQNYKNLIYANAGHLPPMWLHAATGETTRLGKGGPPMGMMDEFDYPTNKIRCEAGDRILIYSDGLVEHKNAADEEFGLERVESMLREHARTPAREFFRILTTALEEWVHEYNDDVSIFLLEIPPHKLRKK